MGMTGLVFGVVAVVWLVYLIPLFLQGRDNGLLDEVEPGEPFSPQVTVVRRGTPAETVEETVAVVSTPLNRRAALRELAATDAAAAARRRRVLGFFVAVTLTVAGFVALEHIAWWWTLVPVGLILAFLVVARVSVRIMRRDLDARAQVVRGGEGVDEPTIALGVATEPAEDSARSIELSQPVEATRSLWDPLPIPAPTYVSRPPAGRTVRTIDLSAPSPAQAMLPITADLPEDKAPEADEDQQRAAGA
ncbi:MAG: hypothetical protein ACK5LS_10530 [Propioniciclava sp.]